MGAPDWPKLLEMASQHGLTPLLYQGLSGAGWDAVPEEIRADLKARYRANAVRNLFLTGELLRISRTLDKKGIPVVALKGPVLAEIAYGDLTLREFADLDVLVAEDDWVRAAELLRELGYQPGWDIDSRLKYDFLRYQGEAWFRRTEGCTIDLHWRVAPKNTALALEAGMFWPRFRHVPIAGGTVLSFAPRDLPLYLASQGGQDEWSDLRRVSDMAALIYRHPELDWDAILAEAQHLRGLRVLLLGLLLASQLLGARLPGCVQERIRGDAALPRLAGEAIQRIANQEPASSIRKHVFQIRVREGLRQKMGLAFSLATDRTDSDGGWVLLPKRFWGLYTVLRPLRAVLELVNAR
jgi:hypothetical protein